MTAHEALDAYVAAKRDLMTLNRREAELRKAVDQAFTDRRAGEARVSAAMRDLAHYADAEAAA